MERMTRTQNGSLFQYNTHFDMAYGTTAAELLRPHRDLGLETLDPHWCKLIVLDGKADQAKGPGDPQVTIWQGHQMPHSHYAAVNASAEVIFRQRFKDTEKRIANELSLMMGKIFPALSRFGGISRACVWSLSTPDTCLLTSQPINRNIVAYWDHCWFLTPEIFHNSVAGYHLYRSNT